MTPDSSLTAQTKAVYFSAYTAIIISLIALSGWFLDIPSLKSIVPGLPEMKPDSALAFAIAGFGLLFLAKRSRGFHSSKTITICGVLVCLIGLITLGEYITGVNLGTGTLIFPESVIRSGNQLSGRMAPQTAVSFIFLGLSLFCLNRKGGFQKASEFLAIFVSITTFVALLAYLYGAEQMVGTAKHNGVHLHTVGLFLLCSFGLLFANLASPTIKLLTSDSVGGKAARSLLPVAVLIPTGITWLWLKAQSQGLYPAGIGASLSVFSCVALMVWIVLLFSSKIHEADLRRRLIEQELAENEQRYHNLFAFSQGMVCIHDMEGELTNVNPAALISLGYKHEEMVGKNLREFLSAENQQMFCNYLLEAENEGISNGLLSLVTKSGKRLVWRYNNIMVTEADKEPYILGHAQDVTELLEAQNQLKKLSLTDELTGLYNRRGFLALAEQQVRLERHEGTARGLTLLFADMDGLKHINDVYGHEAGSDAIRELSMIFSSALRNSDLVARWGGDEFVILTIGSHDDDVELMSERIGRLIDVHNLKSSLPYNLACSIGTAPIPLGVNRSFESIIAEADQAMYEEKRRRRAKTDNDLSEPLLPVAVIPGNSIEFAGLNKLG